MFNNLGRTADRPKICITMGDPAGIGAEITVKALGHAEIYERAKPVVIGSKCVMQDVFRFVPSNLQLSVLADIEEARGDFGTIDLLDLDNIKLGEFRYGVVSVASGRASVEYILKGIELALQGKVRAVVTGPINKEAINAAGYHYSGHTEIFADKTNAPDYAMMLADDQMRVIHVSTHCSLRQACEMVTIERVITVIRLANRAVKALGIAEPKIGVAGLNPHAGEQGLFGREEIDEIIPAITRARQEGINVDGPVSADTLFSKLRGRLYDIAVAMYHDQGHIPIKVTGFQFDASTQKWSTVSGVNATIGLPIVRTSVDHGVAYGKAGKGIANEASMVQAIKMAVKLAG